METNPEAEPFECDPITGATTVVTVVFDRSPDDVRAVITDVTGIGNLGPERFAATRPDGAGGPAVGVSQRLAELNQNMITTLSATYAVLP